MFRGLALFFACVLVAFFVTGGLFVRAAFFGVPSAGADVQITIPSQPHLTDVASLLLEQRVITSAFGYRLYGFLDDAATHPKEGTYRVSSGSSYRTIARLIALGPERNESRVTLIEGWTVDEEIAYLHEQKNVDPQITAALVGRSADKTPFDASLREDFAFLQPLARSRSLEGYLLPETYRVWDDQLPDGLVRKQLMEFAQRFGDVRITQKSAPLATLDEVIILASIVEKEVQTPEDRRHVARIFLNRLRAGIGLQSDATLTYVTGSKRGRATADELALTSLYNTYKYRGLPPGPICNPGEDAIRAVLDPTISDDLYFLTDKDGKVLYAKTLEEQVANKRKAGY